MIVTTCPGKLPVKNLHRYGKLIRKIIVYISSAVMIYVVMLLFVCYVAMLLLPAC